MGAQPQEDGHQPQAIPLVVACAGRRRRRSYLPAEAAAAPPNAYEAGLGGLELPRGPLPLTQAGFKLLPMACLDDQAACMRRRHRARDRWGQPRGVTITYRPMAEHQPQAQPLTATLRALRVSVWCMCNAPPQQQAAAARLCSVACAGDRRTCPCQLSHPAWRQHSSTGAGGWSR